MAPHTVEPLARGSRDDGRLGLGAQRRPVRADALRAARAGMPVGLVEQGEQHVGGLELRVAVADRALLRGGDRPPGYGW